MKTIRKLKWYFLFLILIGLDGSGVFAQNENGPISNYTEIVYLNLDAGNVTITSSTYEGYRWSGNTPVKISGSASSSALYYIYQARPNTSWGPGNPPAYPAVTTTSGATGSDALNIVNNDDVMAVIDGWNAKVASNNAAQSNENYKRYPTSNWIKISCHSRINICLDNIWSTHQTQSEARTDGGLAFTPSQTNPDAYNRLNVYLKGDSRMGNVFYCTQAIPDDGSTEYLDYTNTHIIFRSADGNGAVTGTLTVADIDPINETHNYALPNSYTIRVPANHYNAVIGASDDTKIQDSRGIDIKGGTIFAGAVFDDNCTAIGAGGNGVGVVTIDGGQVTAVTSSTGTAIGGGIGWSVNGGEGHVNINGGKVYAYNHGVAYVYNDHLRYVPATAIGGGSSFIAKCDPCTVNITGGEVYAQSVGGVTIGGGGSGLRSAGDGTVNISGGTVTAKSIPGTITSSQMPAGMQTISVPAGAALGGGTGGLGTAGGAEVAYGGNATIKISGGQLYAGSVGGGAANDPNGKIGSATVTISGGTSQAQFIMAGGSTSHCSYTQTNGTVQNSNTSSTEFILLKSDGGALWMDDPLGEVSISGGTIRNCSATNGGAIYMTNGTFTMTGGTIGGTSINNGNTANDYGGALFMGGGSFEMEGGNIQYNVATSNDGGGIYIASGGTVEINGGTIEGNQALNGNGGGFYVDPGAGKTTTVNSDEADTNITGNTAKNGGGAYVGSGKLVVASTNGNTVSICNNTATENGGALYANSNVEVTGSTICDNEAVNGGGLYLPDAAVTVDFSSGTFSGNYASQCGGGIYLSDHATLNLKGNAILTQNHVPADGQGGGIYLDGTLNVGENADDPVGTHSLKVEDNYAGVPTKPNNVYLHDTDDVITLLSDISGKDSGGNFYSHIGFSVDMGFRPVIYADTEHIVWLRNLMSSTSSLVGAVFDDTQKYIAIHVDTYSAPFEIEYIYLWACWTTAVTSNPGDSHIKLVGDTYHIYTNQGLSWFTSLVNGLNHRPDDPSSNPCEEHQPNLKAVLEADVDMHEFLWVPIGGVGQYKADNPPVLSSIFTAGGSYEGEFDGQGHIIRGLDCRYITAIESYGLFGNMTGGEVRNTFVRDYNFVTQDNTITYRIGGIAGHMEAGVLRNCEAQGVVTASNCGSNTAVGGLVGLAEATATIHSSMAQPYIAQGKASIAIGGLVGKVDGTTASLKNCFSNAKFGNVTHDVGGLVGTNYGTVANCYVRLQHATVPDNFYWFAAANNGTVDCCYARSDAASDHYTTGTAPVGSGNYNGATLVDGKYGYAHQDQDVTATNDYVENGPIGNDGELKGLLATLNNWVEDQTDGVGYSTWTRTMASPINDDLPILEFDDFVSAGSTDNVFIAYKDDLNDMIDYANGNADGGSVYLYDATPTAVNKNTNGNVRVYIDPNVGITQADGNTLNARVGVTLDNSSTDFMAYDWHMFSSALQSAPMGLVYHSQVSGYDIFDHYNTYLTTGLDNSVYGDVTKMDPPQTTWSTTTGQIGYFPTNTPYGPWRGTGSINDGFDFYCYSEPYTHWINFKREGNRAQEFYDHWHQDEDNNGKHWNIPYENETTMKRGKGYMVAITEPSMLMTDGTLDNNPVTVEVSNTTSLTGYEAPLKGVNLIGNPYQAYLDFNKIGNNLNTYFILDADAHGYIAYVSDGSTPDVPGVVNANAPRYIHPHQGFFVHVPQGTTSITLNNTMIQSGNGTSTFRSETNHYPMVNMAVEDERGRRDYTTVELDRPETGGGEKIQGLHAGDASLWVRHDDTDWQVAFTKPGTREVPVRFKAYQDGTFTLSWGAYNGYFSYLHLIDNLTGADIDCLQADEYRFEAKTSDYTSRFRLVFDFTGVEENDEPTEGPTSFAFMMGDELVINGEGVLQMFDLNGRQLFSTEIYGTQATVAMPKVADGIYVLRLTNGNQVRTQKMVINK